MKSRAPSIALAVLLVVLLCVTIGRLYVLRFEVGDVYPPYSSLRADPLGTKALFAALENLPDIEAARAYRDPEPVGRQARRTLLLLGVPSDLSVRDEDFSQLKGLVGSGDRVVMAFLPVQKAPESKASPSPSASPSASASPSPSPGVDEEAERRKSSALADNMVDEFECAFDYFGKTEFGDLEAISSSPALEESIAWNSALYFKPAKSVWRPLYTVKNKPVILERTYGQGSIVLLSDAYLFSNEALREDLSPRLLGYLLGPARQVIFDETLHGIRENPGVAGLMRKYRLEPFVGFAVFLALLFVWQNLIPLVPVPASSQATPESEVPGRDADAGRINLLRRSVPPSALIPECLRLWENSAGRRLAHRPTIRATLHEQATAKGAPPQLYQAIATTLDRDRHPAVNPVNPVNPV